MTHIQAKFQTTAAARGQHRVTSPTAAKRPPTPRLPHVSKLMAHAIRLDHLLANGQVKDQAQIARTALAERTTLKQAALKLGFVSADEFDRLVDPLSMRKPFPLT